MKEQITVAQLIGESDRPPQFSDRGSLLNSKDSPLTSTENSQLAFAAEILSDPELTNLIDSGCVTFAMIKPQVGGVEDLPDNDDEAAERIKNEIGRRRIMLDIPVIFTREDVEEFYGHVKEALGEEKKHIWDSMVEYSTSAPMTALLLFFPEGNAVNNWRQIMGPTWPEKAKAEAPDSIRAKYSQEPPRNIVHGSDSIENVKKELGIIRNNICSYNL